MNPWLAFVGTLLASYFAGAVPFGYLTARAIRRIDIREHGSRNIGATNVGRVLGTKWGLFVLALDFLKGYLPTHFLPGLFESSWPVQNLAVLAGFGTILGHMYPCWLGFSGGKGVATALGVVTSLATIETAAAAGTFLGTFLLSRIISLSSILAVTAFAVAHVLRVWPLLFSAENAPLTLFSLMIPALIIWRHRANIVRLCQGTEPRYASRKSPTPPQN